MSKYLRLVDVFAVVFVSKTFNEIIHQNQRFCEDQKLSHQIICEKHVDEIFFSNFINSGFRIYSTVERNIIVYSFLRYSTENLRGVVSKAGIL